MKKLGIVVLTFAVFLLAGCGTDYAKLEDELTTKAKKYYEDNMKNVYGINQQQITLAAMETAGVDIKAFTKESCDKSSYVLIKLTLDKDGKPADTYKTETHLICGDYETKNK